MEATRAQQSQTQLPTLDKSTSPTATTCGTCGNHSHLISTHRLWNFHFFDFLFMWPRRELSRRGPLFPYPGFSTSHAACRIIFAVSTKILSQRNGTANRIHHRKYPEHKPLQQLPHLYGSYHIVQFDMYVPTNHRRNHQATPSITCRHPPYLGTVRTLGDLTLMEK